MSAAAAHPVDTGSPEYSEVLGWLYREARLLDRADYDGWLALLTHDIIYEMPNRSSVLPKEGQGFHEELGLFAENHSSLSTRVKRLRTDRAWAEQPRSRTRHIVSNVIVSRADSRDLTVESAFLVLRMRSERPLDILSGERLDTLRRESGVLKLQRRRILLDQTVLETHNLSILF